MTNFSIHKMIKAALVIGCFFMTACENDVNEVKALSSRKENIEEGKKIDTWLSTNGKMRAHLLAPLMQRFYTDSGVRTEFPNSLHVDFYNERLQVESKLDAKYGRYLEQAAKVFLKEKVIAFNIKGDTLRCEELFWDQNLQKFYTDKEVTISQSSPKKRFTGIGMNCNQDLSNITLYKIKPGSFAYVSDSLSYDKKPDSLSKPIVPPHTYKN